MEKQEANGHKGEEEDKPEGRRRMRQAGGENCNAMEYEEEKSVEEVE